MCFSSYKNCKLKVKLWWVGAREIKRGYFCTVYFLSRKPFFNVFHLNMSSSQCFIWHCHHHHTIEDQITYTFLLVFKIVECLQYVLKCCLLHIDLILPRHAIFSIFVSMPTPRSIKYMIYLSLWFYNLVKTATLFLLDIFVRSSTSGCCLALAKLLVNFSLALLLKLLLRKNCVIVFFNSRPIPLHKALVLVKSMNMGIR